MKGPEEVLHFWLDEVGPEGWYKAEDALDARIKDTFLTTWEAASKGVRRSWSSSAEGTLAYLILTDQFPRNMFRGQAKAFSTDGLALAVAKSAIDRGWDMRIAEPERQFFYLPLMHSENLCDQQRCVRLICDRMPKTGESNLLHARAHREVIRQFGRFPYRNEALSRATTQSELAYIAQGGYGSTLRSLEVKSKAA
ncbi:MAG: DUF924 family protein [Pseudomonadota bacterium]